MTSTDPDMWARYLAAVDAIAGRGQGFDRSTDEERDAYRRDAQRFHQFPEGEAPDPEPDDLAARMRAMQATAAERLAEDLASLLNRAREQSLVVIPETDDEEGSTYSVEAPGTRFCVDVAWDDQRQQWAVDRQRPEPAPRHVGGNAEDCPACRQRDDIAYPWICPGPEPAALPCSMAVLRRSHSAHPWQPQPGMTPVQCPGHPEPDGGLREQYTEAIDSTWLHVDEFDAETAADAVLAVRDDEMARLRADLAAADDDYHALATHNDKTCEAARERTTLVGQLADAEAKLARLRQMADAWERQLPDVIRTATAVEAIRTAIGEVA